MFFMTQAPCVYINILCNLNHQSWVEVFPERHKYHDKTQQIQCTDTILHIVKTTCTRAEFINTTSAFSCSADYFISPCCCGSTAILLWSLREPGAINVNMIGVILSLGCAPASLTEEPLRASPLRQPIAPMRSRWLCLKPVSPRECL